MHSKCRPEAVGAAVVAGEAAEGRSGAELAVHDVVVRIALELVLAAGPESDRPRDAADELLVGLLVDSVTLELEVVDGRVVVDGDVICPGRGSRDLSGRPRSP